MGKTDNLIDVIGLLYSKRKPLAILGLSVGILAAIIALSLPNYYKATTAFYAASPDLAKPERIFGYSSYDMNYYGSGLDVDRLMTIGFSNELAEFLIDSFDLYTHYDIDPEGEKAEFKIKEELSSLYELLKTKFDAIELSIEDKDREVAAAMANAARSKINELAQKVVKNSQLQVITAYETSIKEKQNILKVVSDSLRKARDTYGIFNTESQAEVLAGIISSTESRLIKEKERLRLLQNTRGIPRDTINLLKAVVGGLEKQFSSMTSDSSDSRFNLSNFNKGKELVDYLDQVYSQTYKQLSYDRIRLDQIKTAYESNITTIHLVEQAKVPIVKSRPKRTILVLGAVFVALVMGMLYYLVIESLKDYDWGK
jgi:hypothetical protein